MALVQIKLFGEFKLIVDDLDVAIKLKSSTKKLNLLQYLIINKKPVSIDKLMEVLWENNDEMNLTSTLKTLVSRVRKELSLYGLENAIITGNGSYSWNEEYAQDVDVFNMENICARLEQKSVLDQETKDDFEEVIGIYSDNLLSSSNFHHWISSTIVYYQNLYIKILNKYIEFLQIDKNYDDVIRICKIGLDILPFESDLNLSLMSALLKKNKGSEALSHYQNITKLHYDYLGVEPSDEIIDFYKDILKNGNDNELKVKEICDELTDYTEETGAFVCEYSIFKEIYSIHMRNLNRLGISIYLAMISITPNTTRSAKPEKINMAMENLLDVLQNNLRSGDTISRCKPTQYAALLPSINDYKVGTIVMERLKKSFHAKKVNQSYIFDYRLIQLYSSTEEDQSIDSIV